MLSNILLLEIRQRQFTHAFVPVYLIWSDSVPSAKEIVYFPSLPRAVTAPMTHPRPGVLDSAKTASPYKCSNDPRQYENVDWIG